MSNKQTNLEDFSNRENPNTVSVQEFADRIKSELKASTSAWWQIARILGDAETQYSFASREMKELIAEVGFSASKANKLIQVSKNERLKDHVDGFSMFSAWTVLYKLTTLSDKNFDQVLKAHRTGTVVSVAWINRVLGQKKSAPKNHKPLFTVQVNIAAIKALEFQGDAYHEVQEALEKLKKAVPHLEITDNGLYDKEYDLIVRDTEKAREKVLRKLVRKAIEECKSHDKDWKSYRDVYVRRKLKLKRPLISSYEDEGEIMSSLEGNIEEVFSNLGVDWYTDQLLEGEMTKELYAMREKYSKRLKSD